MAISDQLAGIAAFEDGWEVKVCPVRNDSDKAILNPPQLFAIWVLIFT